LALNRYVLQIGQGVDQHGHDDDCTKAAIKAIKNAISSNCLCGLADIFNFSKPDDLNRMIVKVKIGAPFLNKINEKKVLKAIPFGVKTLEIVKGGLIAKGVMIKELGDTSENIIICDAAVEVLIKSSD